MGNIFIEGMGTVEIKGDVPDEIESQAIIDALGDDEGEPTITQPSPTSPPAEIPEGPLGIMPQGARSAVRESIENKPGLVPLLAEMAPSVGGGMAGAALGTPGGPLGMLVGGTIGSLLGETAAQETGIAPRSDLNLALSAGGPIIGSTVGKGFQLLRRGAGTGMTKLPFAKAARSQNLMQKSVGEFESIGTRIVGNQKGVMRRTTDELFAAARRVRIVVKPHELSQTRTAIAELRKQMSEIAAFPEVKQAMQALNSVSNSLLKKNPTLDGVVRARSLVGAIVKKAEKAGGIKFGSSKKVFANLSKDLDAIAANPNLKGRQARVAKAAIARAKLDFSIKELEGGVSRFVTETADGKVINIKSMQNWLADITNPKNAKFNKNFTDALSDELPVIKSRLAELAKVIAPKTGAGGPGSLVIRGQSARFGRVIAGGALGGLIGGPAAAVVGGVAGASGPEILVAALTSKSGAAFLEAAAKAGRGKISQRTWQALGTILARASGERKQSRSISATLGTGERAPRPLDTQKKTDELIGIDDLSAISPQAGPINPQISPASAPPTALAKFIEDAEGRRPAVYKDTAGNLTIGVGLNLNRPGARKIIESVGADFDAVKSGKAKLNDAQIEAVFQKTLAQAQDDAGSLVGNFNKLSTPRQKVLVDLAFNMGKSGLSKFKKMLSAIGQENFEAAADELRDSKWFKQVGRRGPRNVNALRRG